MSEYEDQKAKLNFSSDIDYYDSTDFGLLSAEVDNDGWIGPGDAMVLFVGRMTQVKGVHTLVEAMPEVVARHPNAKLVIVTAITPTGDVAAGIERAADTILYCTGFNSTGFITPRRIVGRGGN